MRRDRRVKQLHPVTGIARVEIARPVALGGFGVSFNKNARAGVFLLRKGEHFLKPPLIGTGKGDGRLNRGILAQLIHHQHIAGLRRWHIGVEGVVFAQMCVLQTRHRIARPFHQGAVI